MEEMQLGKFFIEKKAFSLVQSFYVFNAKDEKIMFVDLPSFQIKKKLDFYRSDQKLYKRFSVIQNKVLFVTSAEYTLTLKGDQPLARFRADLAKNVLRRSVDITDPSGKSLGCLAERSALGGLLGNMAGADFVFHKGDETLGAVTSVKGDRLVVDLVGEPTPHLDHRIALGAAIVLYARLI